MKNFNEKYISLLGEEVFNKNEIYIDNDGNCSNLDLIEKCVLDIKEVELNSVILKNYRIVTTWKPKTTTN